MINMKRRLLFLVLIGIVLLALTSCSIFHGVLDNRTGFSDKLEKTEVYIRNSKWEEASLSLVDSKKTWDKLKPLLQIDIDHDYINQLEECLVQLEGYIDTCSQGDSLSTILMIEDTWKHIGTL